MQVLLSLVIVLCLPIVAYGVLTTIGLDITSVSSVLLALVLFITLVLKVAEGVQAARLSEQTPTARTPHPPATAILLADLDLSSTALTQSVESLEQQLYPSRIQILVLHRASNTLPPPIARAAEDDRLVPIAVDSDSGVDQIDAALRHADGTIVGLFRPGQRPYSTDFMRAWCWLSNGHDAVRGRRMVDDDGSWLAHTATIVPGFVPPLSTTDDRSVEPLEDGNLYWLSHTASKDVSPVGAVSRLLDLSAHAIFDRQLMSTEPNFITARWLWYRWLLCDQEWLPFRHGQRHSSHGQRLHRFDAALWRPIYVWLAPQVLFLFAYEIWKHPNLHWFLVSPPLIVLAVLYMLHNASAHAVVAYASSSPELRRRRSWHLSYWLRSVTFFDVFRNTATRVACLHLIGGESPALERRGHRISQPKRPSVPGTSVTSSRLTHDGRGNARVGALDVTVIPAEDARGSPDFAVPSPTLVPIKAPVPNVSRADNRALEMADELVRTVQELVRHLREGEARNSWLVDKVQSLECIVKEQRSLESCRDALSDARLTSDDLARLESVLDALRQNPGDLPALIAVSQRARQLAFIVEMYATVERVLTTKEFT